jgi:allophanate hydrolase subunit 2
MAKTLTISCLKPGGGAYLVDGGRPGYRALGVASGGAADGRAMQAANRLLDRPQFSTCLEVTGSGGQWLLSGQGQFTLTGADMNWRLNGRLVEAYQVQYIDGDCLLTSTPARRGLRAYLAINGEWQTSLNLGSTEAGLPGTETISPGWSTNVNWTGESGFKMDLDVHQHYPPEICQLAGSPGPEWSWLSEEEKYWLLKTTFYVDPDSNRQGIRLIGANAPEWAFPSMISSPVLPGTVQLSPAGPILLGPDAQTIGGYPRVLLVTDKLKTAEAFQMEIGGEVQLLVSH